MGSTYSGLGSGELGRKLENDECFDLDCHLDSVWKIVYPIDGGRGEMRLCQQHFEETLPSIRRPRVIWRMGKR